ncbi:Fic family protein [Sulfurimonas sp.]
MPRKDEKHFFNLTYSALAIAVYGISELDKIKKRHILFLCKFAFKEFFNETLNEEHIKFFHKASLPKNYKSVFLKDGKIAEIKEVKRGEFRKINTYLDLKGHKILFVDYRKIDEEMDKMIELYNSSDKSITDISRVLLEGVRIHPFMDGNGRTFRIIFDLLLLKNNFYPSLFNLIYKQNKQYFSKIFTYYVMVDEEKGLDRFVNSLEDVYKFSYFS